MDFTKSISTEPPEGLIDFLLANKESYTNANVLVFKVGYVKDPLTGMSEKMIQVKCSACGKTYYQSHIGDYCEHYHEIGYYSDELGTPIKSCSCDICAECGAECTAFHVSSINREGRIVGADFPLTIQMINGNLAMVSYRVRKVFDKQANFQIISDPYEAYIFDGRKTEKIVGYYKYFTKTTFTNKWETRSYCNDSYGEIESPFVYPWDPNILNGTRFENCKLDKYIQKSENAIPVTYLRIWQKHKNIENIVMSGGTKIINNMINDVSTGYYGEKKYILSIRMPDWKKVKPHEMFCIEKPIYKQLIAGDYRTSDINIYGMAKKYDSSVRPEDFETIINTYQDTRDFADLLKYGSVMKTIRYIEKQKAKVKKSKTLKSVSYYLYRDYLEMANKLREDINSPKIRFPDNLIKWHDRFMERIKHEESKELVNKFNKRYKKLSKFVFHDKETGLFIRPAASEKELIDEGKSLDHCVGTYAKLHATGKTSIFFVRKEESPNKPYYTLEYRENLHEIEQNHGKSNCLQTPKVTQFEQAWLKWIENGCPKQITESDTIESITIALPINNINKERVTA